jgi:hypothetical protein
MRLIFIISQLITDINPPVVSGSGPSAVSGRDGRIPGGIIPLKKMKMSAYIRVKK